MESPARRARSHHCRGERASISAALIRKGVVTKASWYHRMSAKYKSESHLYRVSFFDANTHSIRNSRPTPLQRRDSTPTQLTQVLQQQPSTQAIAMQTLHPQPSTLRPSSFLRSCASFLTFSISASFTFTTLSSFFLLMPSLSALRF